MILIIEKIIRIIILKKIIIPIKLWKYWVFFLQTKGHNAGTPSWYNIASWPRALCLQPPTWCLLVWIICPAFVRGSNIPGSIVPGSNGIGSNVHLPGLPPFHLFYLPPSFLHSRHLSIFTPSFSRISIQDFSTILEPKIHQFDNFSQLFYTIFFLIKLYYSNNWFIRAGMMHD